MNKKAQGVSINVIIIAIIAMIVLVVVVAIFLNQLGWFTTGISECKGTCKLAEDGCEAGEAKIPGTNCEEDEVCCLPITAET